MKTADLIAEMESYAMAKGTGDLLLIHRQGGVLQALLNKLPEELPEKPETTQTDTE